MDESVDFVGWRIPETTSPFVLMSTINSPVLLAHFDGVLGSQVFIDATGRNSIEANFNAQIDTSQFVFGGASARFDGGNDFLRVPTGNAEFNFDSDFTIDYRMRLNALPPAAQFKYPVNSDAFGAAATRYYFVLSDIGDFSWDIGAAPVISASPTLTTSTWYHVAVARAGSLTKMFIDGVTQGTYAGTESLVCTPFGLCIGGFGNTAGTLNGWIDELRVIKGTAAWTSDFVPPTSAYSP